MGDDDADAGRRAGGRGQCREQERAQWPRLVSRACGERVVTGRKQPRDPAPRGMRARVAVAAAAAWGEPATAHYLGRSAMVSVRFRVPGLRADGSRRGAGPAAWFLGRLPGWVLGAVWLVLTVVVRAVIIGVQVLADAALDTASASYSSPRLRWRRRLVIEAPAAGSGSESLGRALLGGHGHLWIVTSARRLAVAGADGNGDAVLWEGAGRYRPALSVRHAEIRWPDASRVTFTWPRAEGRLLRALSGAPK